jgi:hypothetical protein
VVPHLTPFEQRVAAQLTEEQRVAAAATAVAPAAAGCCDAGSDASSQGQVAQELFGGDASAAAGDA